ncbi:MAG: hypothetical protein IH908_13025, partial [Proteobacteria bacterium]|nr:hypothetical protein [Pseudomonadota bacterium]
VGGARTLDVFLRLSVDGKRNVSNGGRPLGCGDHNLFDLTFLGRYVLGKKTGNDQESERKFPHKYSPVFEGWQEARIIGIFDDIASRFGLSFYLSDTDCIGTRVSLNDAAPEYDA